LTRATFYRKYYLCRPQNKKGRKPYSLRLSCRFSGVQPPNYGTVALSISLHEAFSPISFCRQVADNSGRKAGRIEGEEKLVHDEEKSCTFAKISSIWIRKQVLIIATFSDRLLPK
jgi:hypothetical protein